MDPWSELAQLRPIVFLLCFIRLSAYMWYCKVAGEKVVPWICVCAQSDTQGCMSMSQQGDLSSAPPSLRAAQLF